jgi:hypothetical protein
MGLAFRMDPRREAWSDAMQKGCRSPRRESMHEKREALGSSLPRWGICAGAVLGFDRCRPRERSLSMIRVWHMPPFLSLLSSLSVGWGAAKVAGGGLRNYAVDVSCANICGENGILWAMAEVWHRVDGRRRSA